MANLIMEEPPKHEIDLFKLIGDFLTDGIAYSKEEALELCKWVCEKHLSGEAWTGYSQTLIAEKLQNPFVLSDLSSATHTDDKYIDPLVGTDLQKGNYNSEMKKTEKYK